MTVALKLSLVILSCIVYVQADVGQLGYNRYRNGQRVQSLRLQRLESGPTPYPAAGFRPDREFNLPRDQPLFPLTRQQASNGFDNLGETQEPQLLYGSPNPEPRFPQQNGPHNFNGFHNLGESQQPQNNGFDNGFNNFDEGRQQTANSNIDFNNFNEQSSNNGFNNLAEPEEPELIYGAPSNSDLEPENGVENLSDPQYNYNSASARLRQNSFARLKQSQRLQKLQQQPQSLSRSPSQKLRIFNSPQIVYSAALPSAQQQQQQQRQRQNFQALSESRTSRLIAPKPARLTDNREETDLESDVKTSETVEEIETTTKAETKHVVNQPAATPAVVTNTGVVSYYPATAISYVQPFSGAYVASNNYPTLQPIAAAYTIGSPLLSQQYTFAAGTPAQLQAW